MSDLVTLCLLTLCFKSLFISCATKTSNDFLFNGEFDFVDLTHASDEKTIGFADILQSMLENKKSNVSEIRIWNYFGTNKHIGTHIDSPLLSPSTRIFIADISLHQLILPLIIVDISSVVGGNSNFVLYKYHLDYMLNNYFGRKWQPCLIIFKFGWSELYYDQEKYLGINTDEYGIPNFPGISDEIAEWITTSYTNVVGVGVDVASVDPGASTDFRARRILLDAGLYLLENVKLDEFVPESSCTALVMPTKVARGSSSAVRVTAICPKKHLLTTARPPHTHF